MHATTALLVTVAGWTFEREVRVEDNRVLMEIARTSNNCHHCPTCRRRVSTIEAQLADSSLVWKWEFLPDGGMWLSLPNTDEDPVELLRRTTGLLIRPLLRRLQ